MNETYQYDSIVELLAAIDRGEVDAEKVIVTVDNDNIEAMLQNPETSEIEDMETYIEEIDMQLLAYDDQLPRATLIEVLQYCGVNARPP